MTDDQRKKLQGILVKLGEVDTEISKILPEFSESVKRYFVEKPSKDDKDRFDAISAKFLELDSKMKLLLNEADVIIEQDPEFQFALEEQQPRTVREFRVLRQQLTAKNVEGSVQIESLLPEALNNIMAWVPGGWLEKASQNQDYRLSKDFLTSPLSIVGGIRVKSENCSNHKFAQAILNAKDFLKSQPNHDFFSGSRLIPEIYALGRALPVITQSGKGNVKKHIRKLFNGPSTEVESAIYEMVVAASCIRRGRDIQFIDLSGPGKKPDLRVLDLAGIPTVIECKMRRPLTNYQLQEEKRVQELFDSVTKECLGNGIWGVYDIIFTVELEKVNIVKFAEALRRQPLAAGQVAYDWGTVKLRLLPRNIRMKPIRIYTPIFLQQVFGWNSDLPDFDGIICRVDAVNDFVVDSVQRP